MRLCESKGQSGRSSKVEYIGCALVVVVSLMNTMLIYMIVIMERMFINMSFQIICYTRILLIVLGVIG